MESTGNSICKSLSKLQIHDTTGQKSYQTKLVPYVRAKYMFMGHTHEPYLRYTPLGRLHK